MHAGDADLFNKTIFSAEAQLETMDLYDIYYQQDGATCYISCETMPDLMRANFTIAWLHDLEALFGLQDHAI